MEGYNLLRAWRVRDKMSAFSGSVLAVSLLSLLFTAGEEHNYQHNVCLSLAARLILKNVA